MGELTVALLMAFCAWVAWATPLRDLEEGPLVDGSVFWAAVAVGLFASLAWWVVRFIARKAKG